MKGNRRDCTLCHCTAVFVLFWFFFFILFSLSWWFQIISSLEPASNCQATSCSWVSHVLIHFSMQRGIQSKITWSLPFRETPKSWYLGECFMPTTVSLRPGSNSHEAPRSFSYVCGKLLCFHPTLHCHPGQRESLSLIIDIYSKIFWNLVN